ncbi:hypothetical protein D2E70_16110 [Mycobacteroides abscessus]|uniref:hypothetical protein n=1 Tax=Mycobacteroides abscessus TaxID=36809 RepID=UPI000E6962F2|nr:hypothetical protein [Mycobacteroides abscessus]RIS02729.1 hypothetical protein D2E45_12160 [Mycobacteroides abscessus]RIS67498.1 hypothetical protein D2E70_16110 [Mycobacteroides abscessus]
MAVHEHLPVNLTDTDVISVEVTGPFRVRVTHRDGTSAVHVFDPGEFTGVAEPLRNSAVFAAAAVIGHCPGWELSGGVYDRGDDDLWLHAHGWCDGSHDLTGVVER